MRCACDVRVGAERLRAPGGVGYAVLEVARGLVRDGGDPEYVRAVVEMTCGLLGLSTDTDREAVEAAVSSLPLDRRGERG
jgi:hypothetical protein